MRQRGGQCRPNGYCSFPDLGCESRQRYGEFAGMGLAGECVPVAMPLHPTTVGTCNNLRSRPRAERARAGYGQRTIVIEPRDPNVLQSSGGLST